MKRINIRFFCETTIIPVIILTGLWFFFAFITDSELLLPNPIVVFKRLYSLCLDSYFLKSLGMTILRAIGSFIISFFISIILGFLAGLNKSASNMLRFPMAIIKAAPVVSFILLAIFWFTTNFVPVFVSILMTMPVMTSAVASGLRSLDTKLLTMSKVYLFTKKQSLIHLYIPAMIPYFFSGALSAFGLSWKVVVAAEVLSLPKYAIGTELQTAKVHLETADVFAVTVAVIVVSFIMETIASYFVQKRSKQYA